MYSAATETPPNELPPPKSCSALPALITVLGTVPVRVFVDPVRAGRLRDQEWPSGLRLIVGVAVVAYVIGLVLVVASGPLRAGSELTVPAPATMTVPRAWLWLVLVIVIAALALFQTAALHTAWWLRIVALITSVLLMAQWGIRYTATSGGLVETSLTVVAIVALVVFVILRWRRAFAWWEFGVVWVLQASAVVLGIVVLNRTSAPLGYDFVPTYVLSTVTFLGPVAIPAAVAAGLSVAEITVSATLWTTRTAGRFATARTAYVILAVLLAARMAQAGWQLWVTDSLGLLLAAVPGWLVIGLVLVALWMIMAALARGAAPAGGGRAAVQVSLLPDRIASLALPLGAALVASVFLSIVALTVFSIAGQLVPGVVGRTSGAWQDDLASSVVPGVARVLIGVGLVALAAVGARRGRLADAYLLSAVAVLLWARSATTLGGVRLEVATGSDVLNLLVTAAVAFVVVVLAVLRRLTATRALCLSAAVVMTFLFGYRDFVSDPLGAVFGFSGAALVLFGLTWDLLTGSAIANTGSRKYPVPARVLLVLANSVLAMSILAFTSLVRDPGATIDLGQFAELGDEILGTALVACAFAAILLAVRANRPVD